MLYGAVKIMMTIACRFFYRRLYATGIQSIPGTGPVIIIANHASSLMDAALLGILMERPIHFFTRGDIFKGKIASKLLDSLHMIPVHNFETGRQSLDINDKSFLQASEILADGGIIVFFPEGSSHIDKKLRSFRKGAFRLAFQSAGIPNSGKNITIVPAGINYSHPTNYQADVMIHFGTPILLNDYLEEYQTAPAAALLRITKDSFAAVEKQVLHLQDESKLTLAESCLAIKQNDYTFYTNGWMQASTKKLEKEKMVCSRIENLSPIETINLQQHISDYTKSLHQHTLHDEMLSPKFLFSSYKKLFLFIGLPIFCLGYILNYLPVIVSKRIADTKVYRTDFYSWVYLTSSAFLYIFWLVLLLAGFLIINWKYSVGIVVLTIFSGIFVHHYLQWKQSFVQEKKLKKAKKNIAGNIGQLCVLRQKILETIG